MRQSLFAAVFLALTALAPAPAAEAQTLTRGPLIQNPDALTTTMTILWWTNVVGNSTVEYGLTPALGSSVTVAQAATCEVGSAGTCHKVLLTGLQPGTRYYYRLLTGGVQVLATTYFQTFRERTDDGELLFTVIGDWGADTAAQADVANNQNAADPPLVLTVGDNAYQNGTQSDWDNNAFIPAYRNGILRRAVWMPTLGNHDLYDVGDTNWASSVEIRMHALPRNAPAGQAERYFSFDHGDAHFVILDSNPPGLNTQQTNWLEADLAANTRKWTFVFLHHPPYSCANGLISFGSDFTVRNLWGPIFEKYEVDVVFDGHDHVYERTGFVDHYLANGSSGQDGKGTRYILTGGGGENLDSAANADGGGAYRQPLFGNKSYCPWLANDCPNGVGGQYCSFARFQHAEVRLVDNQVLTVKGIDRNNIVFDTMTITKLSTCGDGQVEAEEQCDEGAANGTAASCCTETCQLRSAGLTCRASAGVCDVAETCDGVSGACPANEFVPPTATCRASTGACDPAEMCTGTSAACPADALEPSGTLCRAAFGACDLPETCDGTMAVCPADVVAGTDVLCRPAAGACDIAEYCAGGAECPVDTFLDASNVCRASSGPCDQAESCSGSSASCPADAFVPAGNECRAAAGPCDAPEACTGLSPACPADAFASAGVQCRPALSACDVAEQCTGSSIACPADAYAAAGVECRAAAGPCDVAEQCTGAAPACPADTFVAAGTECRPATDVCDMAETCTGAAAACPADQMKSSGTECCASAGACDPAEKCTGSSPSCPPDQLSAANTLCRPTAGVCDVAERCTGSDPECPEDAFLDSSVQCRGTSGPCDVPEHCSGEAATCPPNSYVEAGTECRASTDLCDRAEQCTGMGVFCPPDLLEPAGTLCRAAADLCDKPETCSGLSAACPADAMQPAGFLCRPAANACDAPEVCTGLGIVCPLDTGLPDSDGDGVCDILDVCPDVADAGQEDSDGDGIGDACDPCNNTQQIVASKPKLQLRGLTGEPGTHSLKLSGAITVPVAPPIDPSLNGLRLLLRTNTGYTVFDATLPGGAYDSATRFGWKVNGSRTAFSWQDSGTARPLIAGLYKLSLKVRADGTVRFKVSGRAGDYAVTVTDLPLSVTVVLDVPVAAGNQCGEVVFDGVRSDCAAQTLSGTVKCK